MRSRNRLSKTRASRSRRRSRDDSPVITRHPFSDIDPETLRAAFANIARKRIAEFPELILRLKTLFQKCYPPHIIAVMAAYGTFTGVSDEGVAGKSMLSGISQHHIELMLALALHVPQAEWGQGPADPQDIQSAIDSIVSLADAFHQRRMLAAQATTDPQEHMAIALREKLRMHTQIVRNWGYASSVRGISRELYAALDQPFLAHHGFSASDVIVVAQGLLDLIEKRVDARYRKLQRVFRERKIPRLVRQFCKLFPEFEGDPEAILRALPASASFEEVRARLLSHADIQLVVHASIAPDAVAEHSGLPAAIVAKVLDAISLEPDALCANEPEQLFLDNPVWTRPIMKTRNEFFCPIPFALFSHIHEVMRRLTEYAGAKAALEERRAAYLESKTAELLETALPGCRCWRNVRWRVGDQTFETDIAAKLDRTIVLVEAKSAALTGPGLRGAPDRVKRHVQELIRDPSQQSARLEKLIWDAKKGKAEATQTLATFGDGFADVDLVVRLSVTLDDFSTLASSEIGLKAAGWIPKDLQLACTINISDFESVIALLADPARFVHYFAERQRFQKDLEMIADEIDFLGLYLQTSFNFTGFENPKTRLILTGMSQAVDHYFESCDAGVRVPKPEPAASPYFKRLLDAVQRRKMPGWLSISVDLFRSADHRQQRRIEAALEKLKRNVERNWREPEHECSLIITPPRGREAALMFHVYPPQLVARRQELAQELASKALAVSQRPRCIIVGRNTARWSEPYSFVGTATPPSD